jgi:geranylgeranyl diphosphate synthase type I
MNNRQKKLISTLEKFTKIVDPVIKKVLILDVSKKFRPLVKYPISTGGKRIRPALAMISCLMLGGKLKDVLCPAAGLEILHNYTLIIDDIIDHDKLRRNKPTTWFKFGNSIAQCIGIDYAATIFQTANKSKKPVLISELFSKALKEVVEGEILDILFERAGRDEEPYVVKNRYRKIREKDYFEMISKKTAALFQASCEVGGICANAKKKGLGVLRRYGFNYGMVFQITDDILDIFGKEKKLGKKIGNDIEEGKRGNIIIPLVLRRLKITDKNKLLGILEKDKIGKQDIKEAMILINRTNSRQEAYKLAERFAEKAKDALAELPQNKWNNTLEALVDFTLKREK